MPKLKNRPPKMGKMGNYAVVHYQGGKIVLGKWGSDEAKQAYGRFITELQNNPLPNVAVIRSGSRPPESREGLISELATVYLAHIKASDVDPTHYGHMKVVLQDFLLPLYAGFPTNSFSPKCLKAVRSNMVASKRFCRNLINDYTRRIVAMFHHGIEEELVSPLTVDAIRAVKPLKKGAAGTFDHPPREGVPDNVIYRTLLFLTQTVAAMVQLQWLLGFRPSEVCKMRVGEIDCVSDPDCWIYTMAHKTSSCIGDRKIYLSTPMKKLIAPYLTGKKPEDYVFTPAQSERERHQRLRSERKTPVQPSQIERAKRRAANPGITFAACFDKTSYRKSILYAIDRANTMLPADQQIPHWTPYQIRHSTATRMELEEGLDEAQAVLGHTSADMTKRYARGRERIQKRIALKQINPFETDNGEGVVES